MNGCLLRGVSSTCSNTEGRYSSEVKLNKLKILKHLYYLKLNVNRNKLLASYQYTIDHFNCLI